MGKCFIFICENLLYLCSIMVYGTLIERMEQVIADTIL